MSQMKVLPETKESNDGEEEKAAAKISNQLSVSSLNDAAQSLIADSLRKSIKIGGTTNAHNGTNVINEIESYDESPVDL